MSKSLPNIIQYFHDCYRSDNRELVIFDFLDRKVEDRLFIEGKEELLTGEHPLIPINSEKAKIIIKKLEVFQKEKELIYGSFFVCGSYIDFKGDTKSLCSPLFYHPAEITAKEEFHYLSIRESELRINYPLINLLSKGSETDLLQDPFFKTLPKDLIKFDHIRPIVELCKKYIPNLAFDNIYGYPDNSNLKTIKKTQAELKKNNADQFSILPSSIIGIVTKSTNTRGVLNELSELANLNDHSLPLQSLFSDSIPHPKTNYRRGIIPMILSEAQEVILKSSSTNPLTLIIGPPGTGKSYTIGAIAIEHMSRGESVLIASRTNEAVDVIVEKITTQLGNNKCVVRGGKKRSYSTPLNRFLKALLTRANPLQYLLKEFNLSKKIGLYSLSEEIEKLSSSIHERKELISTLESSFINEVDNEVKWGDHLSKSEEGLWNKLKTHYLDLRNYIQTPIWELSGQLHEKDKDQIADILKLLRLKYINQVTHALKHHWNDLKYFREGLKLSNDTEKLKKFDQVNFSAILTAFPIWLTNLSEVKDVLPFQKEMFDVAIIDEATQCDIASCLPLMQRAKRVVFAGDFNQLKHISFLSKGIQHNFQSKHHLQNVDENKLNYRDQSILDLAMNALRSGNQVAMLDEHFRSVAPIISFSNTHFYDHSLKIMTERPDEKEPGIYLVSCDGIRNKNGSNQDEAAQLLKDIRALIQLESEIDQQFCTTLGILSPFRGQVELLAKMLIEHFSLAEIEKHKIRVGTAYSFQGEERDFMYLSFAVDQSSHHAAFMHINKADVFNVSITRARRKQFIYLSITENKLKHDSLLHLYLANTKKGHSVTQNETVKYDRFLDEVKSKLTEWNIELQWAGFSMAGMKVDLLIKHKEVYLGIDLVGYPGDFEASFGIERYRILNRAGIKFFPLPYSDWYFENESTQQVLKEFIHQSIPVTS